MCNRSTLIQYLIFRQAEQAVTNFVFIFSLALSLFYYYHILHNKKTAKIVQRKTQSPHQIHCVKSVQIRSIFWSVFSRIWTEYGEILRISPYSARMWENTDQKILRIWTLFRQWFIIKIHLWYICDSSKYWNICRNTTITFQEKKTGFQFYVWLGF